MGSSGGSSGGSSDGSSMNGEDACEHHGFDQGTCASSSCCEWDDGRCWSRIGVGTCHDPPVNHFASRRLTEHRG
jgi:hypothetical protein